MYNGVAVIFKRYWDAYGGCRALYCSPYLHLAILLLFFTTHYWWSQEWWNQVLSIIPNLLGFTLGGFAIFIGFGDEKFRSLLAQTDSTNTKNITVYVSLCSTFVHFIIVQMLALLYAIVIQSIQFPIILPKNLNCIIFFSSKLFSFIGYGLFLYALTSMLAATMHIFRIAFLFSEHQKTLKRDDN